jgi:two-component system chemotaxis sensor kinase CheA
MDEVLREFVLEGFELLDQFDRDLVSIENAAADQETVNRAFRAVHTIKGSSGVLGFGGTEAVSHAGENLLDTVRKGRGDVNAEVVAALFDLSDRLREEMVSIESTGQETGRDLEGFVEELQKLTPPKPESSAPPAGGKRRGKAKRAVGKKRGSASGKGAKRKKRGASAPGPSTADDPKPKKADEAGTVEASEATEADAPKPSAPPSVPAAPAQPAVTTASSVHVRVETLDSLINLVGELVLVRNQMLALPSAERTSLGWASVQRLNTVAGLLQQEVMKTRMQPIGRLWRSMPRLVRDLARGCRKEVDLVVAGEDTEVDRTVIEAIGAPVTHIIRNAIDHGIESPEEREAAGKSRRGQIELHAFHRSGQVTISISDDGAGIDVDKVRARAVEAGLISREAAETCSKREALKFIFHAGLTTSTEVTTVSGRGVGMNVVESNVAALGGSVDVHTEPGIGTVVEIRIPLTLTIVPALIVAQHGQRYAIPQTSVMEIVEATDGDADVRIEAVHESPVLRHRDELVPVLFLEGVLKLDKRETQPDSTTVMLQAHDSRFGLVVDEVIDYQEIVVRPLDRRVGKAGVFSGATIMGDGCAALILDVVRIAQKCGVVSGHRSRSSSSRRRKTGKTAVTRQVLLMRGPDDGRLVLDLADIAHLERIETDSIENLGGRKAVTYRDEVLPLVEVADLLAERRETPRHAAPTTSEDETCVHVVVCKGGDRQIGVIVDRVMDIVDAPPGKPGAGTRDGIAGTMLLDDRICELLDIDRIRAAAAALGGPVAQDSVQGD